jgi:molecular chaperone DnaK (HSP70)
MGLDSSGILLDITPYTFGTSALGELDGELTESLFVPLIRRNTKLPAVKSEVFWTVVPGQERVQIQVYQGEDRDALNNILIGNYRLDLSPGQPEQSPVILKYELDFNGILKITAIEKNTGKQITGVIENAFSEISQDTVSASKNKIDDVWESQDDLDTVVNDSDEEETATPDEMPEAFQSLISRARDVLEDASAEDCEEIVNLIEDIEALSADNNFDDAQKSAQALEDILFYLE